jgi:hypothetical protein
MHDRFRDHAVNPLGAVHRLRHPQIRGQAAERVGVLARQIALFAEIAAYRYLSKMWHQIL